MPGVVLVHADPVEDITPSSQSLNSGSMIITMPTTSDSIMASQTQGAPQTQRTSSTATHVSTTVLDVRVISSASSSTFKTVASILDISDPGDGAVVEANVPVSGNDALLPASRVPGETLASSTTVSVVTDDEMTNQSTRFQSAHSVLKTTDSLKTITRPIGMVKGLNVPITSGKTVVVYHTGTFVPSPTSNIQLDLTLSTPTITAEHTSNYIFPPHQSLSPNTTITLGSGIPTVVLFHQTASTQSLFMPGSSTTLISPTATTPKSFKKVHYTKTQTLTPGRLSTTPGATMWPAPNKSAIVVGLSTEALGPSITASIGSVPNGTEAQKFAGGALGARDGLWSPSFLLLFGLALLLRL